MNRMIARITILATIKMITVRAIVQMVNRMMIVRAGILTVTRMILTTLTTQMKVVMKNLMKARTMKMATVLIQKMIQAIRKTMEIVRLVLTKANLMIVRKRMITQHLQTIQ